MTYKCLDLFSGIGGMALGFEKSGIESAAFCDTDKAARAVLSKHWPRVPQYEDVQDLTNKRLSDDGIRGIGVISAGFPCQPYSRGNWRRKGSGDIRDMSGEVIRLVEDIEPAVFVGENTEGFLDIGFDAFANDLEDIGYSVQALSIPACGVGLPTLERHVWIIATTSSERLQRYIEKAFQGIEQLQRELRGSYQGVGERWDLSRPRVRGSGERVSGRMDRLKQLGNAVDPVISELIGGAILDQ